MGERIIALAEHLVNLQEIDGFESCLVEIKGGDVESGLAKLIGAGMLRRRSIPFRFVVPSGRQRQDYDAEAIIGASIVPIEMKAKVEGKAPSSISIGHSLKRARKQLPRNSPNLVFLRVPEDWGKAEAGRLAIVEGVLKEFENSRAIGLVVVHWERWSRPPNMPKGGQRGERLMVIGSGRARVDLEALKSALDVETDNSQETQWLTFQALLCPERVAWPTQPARSRERSMDDIQERGDLTLIGPVILKHAHLCEKAFQDPHFFTYTRVRQLIHLPQEPPYRLPTDCTLVLTLEEYGRRPGKRDLKILFSGTATYSQQEVEFVQVEKGMAHVARQIVNVGSLQLPGPGVYTFDFLVEGQFVGRLPFVAFTESMPSGQAIRNPLWGDSVTLEYGHVVEDVTPPEPKDPEFAVTFTRIIAGVPILENKPFRLHSMLVFALSAAGNCPIEHTVTVQARDSQQKGLAPTHTFRAALQPRLPGELYLTQTLVLSEAILYPGAGDYEFAISADEKEVGTVKLPVRVVHNIAVPRQRPR